MKKPAFLQGSFTVEMALIFPVILLTVVLLMELAMSFTLQIAVRGGAERALTTCRLALEQGQGVEEAKAAGEEALFQGHEGLSEGCEVSWNIQQGLLKEEVGLKVHYRTGRLFSVSADFSGKAQSLSPTLFKNRADYIYEKVRGLLSEDED